MPGNGVLLLCIGPWEGERVGGGRPGLSWLRGRPRAGSWWEAQEAVGLGLGTLGDTGGWGACDSCVAAGLFPEQLKGRPREQEARGLEGGAAGHAWARLPEGYATPHRPGHPE